MCLLWKHLFSNHLRLLLILFPDPKETPGLTAWHPKSLAGRGAVDRAQSKLALPLVLGGKPAMWASVDMGLSPTQDTVENTRS